MNTKLKEVLEAVSRLPERDQEELAAVILQELEDESRWEAAFEASQPQLKRLAEEAVEEYRAGRTEPLDPDAL
jgi:aspartate/glutamate racemase